MGVFYFFTSGRKMAFSAGLISEQSPPALQATNDRLYGGVPAGRLMVQVPLGLAVSGARVEAAPPPPLALGLASTE